MNGYRYILFAIVIPRGFDCQYDNAFECEWRVSPRRWENPAI